MQPVFFTDLPVLAKFSVEHADILKAINERKELEIAVYDLPGQTCCGVVSPLWMTDCTGKTDLVFRFPDTITRRRIPVEQLVRWEII